MDDTNTRVIANAAPAFPSFIALRAEHSELLQREPNTEEVKKTLLDDAEHFIAQVQATGVILSEDEERRASQNILNYWVSVLYRADNVARLVTLANYDPKLTTQITDVSCPYPGVRAFTEQDSQFFFGRQRQIDYMVGRLKEDRLLVIVGASGSGKTSLVQAGLFPALKKEQPNDLKHFFFSPTAPGSEPLMSLALMVKRAKKSVGDDPQWLSKQVQGFQRDKGHLLKLIEEITDEPAVIFIDQGEELFERSVNKVLRPLENILDLNNSKKTIEPFLDNLVRVVQSPDIKHIVIIARRLDDYQLHFKLLPSRVKGVFEPARMILPPLYASELRDAIEKPAELLGVKFEEAVSQGPDAPESGSGIKLKETTVQALIKEISSEPAGLPLLQFTLPRLWNKRDGAKIPDEAFRELGSCRAALSDTAEKFYSTLNYFEQRTCRRLLTQLVTLNGDLRAHVYPVRRTALYSTDKQSRVDSLIDRLAEQQLIRVSKGEMPRDVWVELIHDSLINDWPTMSSWIESKRRARRRSQIVKVVGLAAVFAVLFLAVMLIIGWEQEKTKSRELARRSDEEFNNHHFDLALQFGREAYLVEANVATRSNTLKLLSALQSTSNPKMFLNKDKFEADDMAFSAETVADPIRLAAVDAKGNILIWNLISRELQKTLASGGTATYPLAFSPDGKTLATASNDPAVKLILWDVESGQPTNLTEEQKKTDGGLQRITSLAFAPDGKSLVTGDSSGNVVQWELRDTNNLKSTFLYKHLDPTSIGNTGISSLVFSDSGNRLASGSYDGTAILSNLRVKGARRRTFAVRGEVTASQKNTEYKPIYSLAFSPEKDALAAGSGDEVFVWDITTGKSVDEFSSGPKPAGILVAFGDQGKSLRAFSFDGTLILWDPRVGATGRQFYKPGQSHSASFSNNGKLLALPGDNGVVVWEVASQRTVHAVSRVNSIAFSPSRDGQIMASGEENGALTLWKTASSDLHEPTASITEDSFIRSLAFSADGSMLAVGLQNGTVSLRDTKNLNQISVLDAQTGKLVKKVSETPGEQPGSQSDARGEASEVQAPPVAVTRVVFDPEPGSSRLAALVAVLSNKAEPAEVENQNVLPTKIILWNTANPTSPDVLTDSNDVVTSLAFSPDGQTLAWGSRPSDSNDKNSFKVVLGIGRDREVVPCDAGISSLAFNKKGQILAIGLDNGQIRQWNLGLRRLEDKALQAEGRVTDLAFNSDGTILAAATNENKSHPQPGVITLWDVESQEKIGNKLVGHDGTVSGIVFSADGKMLASISKDDQLAGTNDEVEHYINLWDLNVDDAGKRFCTIVDCQHERAEVADQVNKRSWFQSLYRKISSWFK
jgi:WD40 repeat protein